MKLIKLLAFSLLLIPCGSVMAVTLPSTSYGGGYTSSSVDEGEVVFSSGAISRGSFVSLGTGSKENCEGDGHGYTKDGLKTCSKCCDEQFPCEEGDVTCEEQYYNCVDYCWSGQSPVPLDGGLTILLALAFGSGALKFFRARKEA